MRVRSTICLALFLIWALVSALCASGPALASPGPSGDFEEVILPGNEEAARDLLAPLFAAQSGELEWRGPSIEIGQIKFWLMREGQARGLLVLSPRALAGPDSTTSESFMIEVAWDPEVTPDPREQALMTEAVASVQANDHGGFYVVRATPMSEQSSGMGLDRTSPFTPAQVQRRWSLKVGAVMLIGLAALGVTIRRRPRA